MKKLLLLLLLFPGISLAQNQGDDLGLGSGAKAMLGRVNEAGTNIASGDGKGNYIATDRAGKVYTRTGTGATEVGKVEDGASASGDAGSASLFIYRNSATGRVDANDDYINPAANRYGAPYVDLNILYQGDATAANSPIRAEDAASATGDAGIVSYSITEDPLTVSQGSTGDFGAMKLDRAGRAIITMAPAGEMWQACGTATASTADVAIKAAVASNRIYVTSITCKNTSATTATSLDFKDATTVIAVGGISQMAAGAPGSFATTFPVPLRGTSNTALNFATNISVTSVTCCANGYISVN